MRGAIENHIRAADAFFRPLILLHGERFPGGARLLAEFDNSASAFHKYGRRQVSGLIERVNELCVARQLLLEPNFASARVEYEPEIVKGPKFDFVIRKTGEPPLYLEVKTVGPVSSINELSWRKARYEVRQVVLDTAAASSEPEKRAEGLKAVRATFLKNTVETGIKLANHAAIEPGPGVLILCGDGQAWGRAQLDEFAKVYFNERVDFGVMIRQQDGLVPTLFEYLPQPVRLT